MQERILRLPTVEKVTGLPRSTIYLKISQNLFPSQISLGKRSVGWLESEITKWINQRISESTTGERTAANKRGIK